MKYQSLIFIMLSIVQEVHALRSITFCNEADKKMRLVLFYKRYDIVDDQFKFSNHKHKFITYIKPCETITVTLRPKKHDGLEMYCAMAINTRRRNEWGALTYNDLQDFDDYTIVYDDEGQLIITPS